MFSPAARRFALGLTSLIIEFLIDGIISMYFATVMLLKFTPLFGILYYIVTILKPFIDKQKTKHKTFYIVLKWLTLVIRFISVHKNFYKVLEWLARVNCFILVGFILYLLIG